MLSNKLTNHYLTISLFVLCLACCTKNKPQDHSPLTNNEAALDYLKGLKGEWVVDGGKEGIFGWEFDVTSRGKVVVERLKTGTPTEMTTVYHLDYLENGNLVGNHYCQLQNQPNLRAVTSEVEGDLHFLCDGSVGSTKSHDELHMHGVHFQKKGSSLMIWMDMHKNGSKDFETRYRTH